MSVLLAMLTAPGASSAAGRTAAIPPVSAEDSDKLPKASDQLTCRGVLPNDHRILPEGWMTDAVHPSAASARLGRPYGYNWWLRPPGEAFSCPSSDSAFYGRGSSGQVLLLVPAENLVILKWANWDNRPASLAADRDDAALFAAIANELNTAARGFRPAPGHDRKWGWAQLPRRGATRRDWRRQPSSPEASCSPPAPAAFKRRPWR